MGRLLAVIAWFVVILAPVRAQVIEFESNGLKYQTLTRSGVTVMWATLPMQLQDYQVIQVAVSNGSGGPYVIRPEDFTFVRADGRSVKASPAGRVVNVFFRKGSGSDVIKLVTAYEASVYGITNFKSTNGYEQRRQGALAMTSTKVKAAATASALALVQTKLLPGDSTDGAVFFPTEGGKALGQGYLVVRTNTDVFNFGTN